MSETFNPKTIDKQAQTHWSENQSFKVFEDPNKQKFYCLSMLPYPSGSLHMGHVRNYTIGDTISRYQRMLGKNVLQPMGWDAFGLPAENAAIKNKASPAKWTYSNIDAMRTEFKSLGFAFDWDREFATCDASYYKWEQWLFIQLFNKGLIYRKNSIVNWDPVDQTVLANEQVVDGKGWRSGAQVEKKAIPQWFVKITDYADELLDNLDDLKGWPDQVKTMQRNWIGRSEGMEIKFDIENSDEQVTVYTTRVDTIMGTTFLAVSPEHPLAKTAAENNPTLLTFIETCKKTSTMEADMATMEKLGMATGLQAIHPISKEPVPVWTANFVLMNYGCGAVMGVPGHCERDHEFAQKYGLPIVQVIKPEDNHQIDVQTKPFLDQGITCHSGIDYDGLTFETAVKHFHQDLSSDGRATKKTNYRLRDWGVSRQRYWGTPIPMIYCEDCGAVPEKEENLPVKLPEIENLDNGNPLKTMDSFINTPCPACGRNAKRETDTLDTFFESSWYYARYTCPDNHTQMLDERADYWLPVDQYIGGVEHAVMHLLYARFFHKLLRDTGLVKSSEPFVNMLTQGMVLKDSVKMSKSKGNVVAPGALIDKFGADTVRLFSIFAAPPEQSLEWSDSGVEGCYRYLKKLWQYATTTELSTAPAKDSKARAEIHQLLKQADQDMKRQQLNTIVSGAMKILNCLTKADKTDSGLHHEGLSILLRLLAPITPHICHALWQQCNFGTDILMATWPVVDETALVSDSVTIGVQINGKVRGKIELPTDADQEMAMALANANENIAKYLDGQTIRKVILVPNRILNIVVGG